MENCAIYSHYTDMVKVLDVLNALFEPSQIDVVGSKENWSEVKQKEFKINPHLPNIVTEEEARLRLPREIAVRVTVLAVLSYNEFIKNITESRSVSEILDAADLYYRLEWACVDERLKGREMEDVHPGVVYERHDALNWLIHHMDREWDDIICDT